MNSLYPETLTPDHEETFDLDGTTYTLPATSLKFKQWQGESIKNTFGGKPLVDYEGVPMFAELAIQRTAVKGGWNSRWIETYAMKGNLPYYFTNWLDVALTQQAVEPLNDPYQEELLKKVALQNDNSFYGCWDVLA